MPDISQTLTGYTFEWAEHNLIVKVSRIRPHTDGRITADISIILGKDKQEEPTFSFNFSSSTTRKQLIKSLNEKYPDWVWLEIIDELSRQVQKLALTGEPVKELWTSEDMEPPKYLLEPILLEGLPTIIFGEKGVTKSYFAQLLYLILSLPWKDNALGLIAPKRQVKTLYLDWELPGNIAQWNMKKLIEGMDLGAVPLLHRHCSSPLSEDLEQIQGYIEETKAEVIIIDSLGRACGGDLSKDTENANRFFVGIDKLKTTSLILAQTSKGGEGKSKSIFGSAFFTYYARSIFELCKADTLGDDEISVALFHRASNLTRLQSPMGFRFSFNGNHTYVESQTVTYSEFLEKVNRQAQVLEILRGGSMTTPEIMSALDMTRSNADTVLKRLKDKQKIVRLEDKWGLMAKMDKLEW